MSPIPLSLSHDAGDNLVPLFYIHLYSVGTLESLSLLTPTDCLEPTGSGATNEKGRAWQTRGQELLMGGHGWKESGAGRKTV